MIERDDKGRWLPGTSPNPQGRPPKSYEEKYYRAIRSKVKLKDIREVLDRGLAKAKAGDLGWARFIFEYAVGKPAQDLNINEPGTIVLTWSDAEGDSDTAASSRAEDGAGCEGET